MIAYLPLLDQLVGAHRFICFSWTYMASAGAQPSLRACAHQLLLVFSISAYRSQSSIKKWLQRDQPHLRLPNLSDKTMNSEAMMQTKNHTNSTTISSSLFMTSSTPISPNSLHARSTLRNGSGNKSSSEIRISPAS